MHLENPRFSFITHYYLRGTVPFRSLSPLPDKEAHEIMRRLADETLFGLRFKDPEGYLARRRQSEKWVHNAFAAKGGQPRQEYPVYFVLGESGWLAEQSPDKSRHTEIRIPLDAFEEGNVSFTYPDSMISRWFAEEKPPDLYQPDLHGRVFMKAEILEIIKKKGNPEQDWPKLPPALGPYIEAQVWNMEPLNRWLAANFHSNPQHSHK